MRPLPASPTNTFQSPKVATRAGLEASSFFSVFGAALAGLVAAVAAATGGASALAAQAAAPTSPMARRDERTRRVIDNNPLNRAQARLGGFPAARSGRNSGLSPCRRGRRLQSCPWLMKNE